ncbi:MAG: hypothetical protein ACTSXH_11805 [Promethearchaeota archaeon]
MIEYYLDFFGQIKFAEEKSIFAVDFERSFRKFFSENKRPLEKSNLGKYYGKLKFMELYSHSLDDFRNSLNEYFY